MMMEVLFEVLLFVCEKFWLWLVGVVGLVVVVGLGIVVVWFELLLLLCGCFEV